MCGISRLGKNLLHCFTKQFERVCTRSLHEHDSLQIHLYVSFGPPVCVPYQTCCTSRDLLHSMTIHASKLTKYANMLNVRARYETPLLKVGLYQRGIDPALNLVHDSATFMRATFLRLRCWVTGFAVSCSFISMASSVASTVACFLIIAINGTRLSARWKTPRAGLLQACRCPTSTCARCVMEVVSSECELTSTLRTP